MRRLLAILLLLASPALAVEPDERLDDPVLEERARTLSQDLRCLVCRNESIDESNAELARDLRLLVRERIMQPSSSATPPGSPDEQPAGNVSDASSPRGVRTRTTW